MCESDHLWRIILVSVWESSYFSFTHEWKLQRGDSWLTELIVVLAVAFLPTLDGTFSWLLWESMLQSDCSSLKIDYVFLSCKYLIFCVLHFKFHLNCVVLKMFSNQPSLGFCIFVIFQHPSFSKLWEFSAIVSLAMFSKAFFLILLFPNLLFLLLLFF